MTRMFIALAKETGMPENELKRKGIYDFLIMTEALKPKKK